MSSTISVNSSHTLGSSPPIRGEEREIIFTRKISPEEQKTSWLCVLFTCIKILWQYDMAHARLYFYLHRADHMNLIAVLLPQDLREHLFVEMTKNGRRLSYHHLYVIDQKWFAKLMNEKTLQRKISQEEIQKVHDQRTTLNKRDHTAADPNIIFSSDLSREPFVFVYNSAASSIISNPAARSTTAQMINKKIRESSMSPDDQSHFLCLPTQEGHASEKTILEAVAQTYSLCDEKLQPLFFGSSDNSNVQQLADSTQNPPVTISLQDSQEQGLTKVEISTSKEFILRSPDFPDMPSPITLTAQHHYIWNEQQDAQTEESTVATESITFHCHPSFISPPHVSNETSI